MRQAAVRVAPTTGRRSTLLPSGAPAIEDRAGRGCGTTAASCQGKGNKDVFGKQWVLRRTRCASRVFSVRDRCDSELDRRRAAGQKDTRSPQARTARGEGAPGAARVPVRRKER